MRVHAGLADIAHLPLLERRRHSPSRWALPWSPRAVRSGGKPAGRGGPCVWWSGVRVWVWRSCELQVVGGRRALGVEHRGRLGSGGTIRNISLF